MTSRSPKSGKKALRGSPSVTKGGRSDDGDRRSKLTDRFKPSDYEKAAGKFRKILRSAQKDVESQPVTRFAESLKQQFETQRDVQRRLEQGGVPKRLAAEFSTHAIFLASDSGLLRDGGVATDPAQRSAAAANLAKFALAIFNLTSRSAGGHDVQPTDLGQISLPDRAREIWMERDRSKLETPIDFLGRVWGPWMTAGVLYQDDIKRLGDDKLVQAVRNYCLRHPELNSSDVLPPPQKVRLERALAEAKPGSPAEKLIKRKMRDRELIARRRAGPPQPKR